MKIYLIALLLVSVCVCTETLATMKLVRKIHKWVKYLKKERFEEQNRNAMLIFKDKGREKFIKKKYHFLRNFF
jgi:hypothetical protein